MARKEKDIHVMVDDATFEALSIIAKRKKQKGEKASVSGVAAEILEQATGNIDDERPVKFRDLKEFKIDILKQYERGIDRVAKIWFKSSRLIITMMLVFLDKMAGEMGEKKIQKMLDDSRKKAVAMLKRKEDDKEGKQG